jgi:exoribonuclease R
MKSYLKLTLVFRQDRTYTSPFPLHILMSTTHTSHNGAIQYLTQHLGIHQEDYDPSIQRGILQTTDYETFELRSDTGELLRTFQGAKVANRCLPGDHVRWDAETGRCELELRDEHPLLVGTLHLTQPARYGFTSRKIPLYLFTPYDERYPQMVVGCSEKDKTCNRIILVQWESWSLNSLLPRGLLQVMLGQSGEMEVEKRALRHQVCPWKYPKIPFIPHLLESGDGHRQRLTGTTFHVDPEGCLDVDDVITFEAVGGGKWRVVITISDVAAYIEDGGAVDIMASLVSQTVYDQAGRVLHPMLPTPYAEGVCSLLPGGWKRGVSLEFLWNGHCLSDRKWYESIFETQETYTYESILGSPHQGILQEISSALAGIPLKDSHHWIEQLMILYNKEAGRMLREAGIGILRRHAVAEQEKLERYRQHLPEWQFLAMSSAEYVLAEEKETYHSGLHTDAYAHVTSPIRRYADLVNQRALKGLLHGRTDFIVPVTMYDMNRRERAIRQFERDTVFLEAVERGQTRVKAILMDYEETDGKESPMYQIQFYVPDWKKRITGRYPKAGENQIQTKDGTQIRILVPFMEVELQCAVQWGLRNWKERLLVQWI